MLKSTDGHRIYAIGDIHGCLHDLEDMQLRIADDLDRRPHDRPVVVYLGDLGDRGADTRGVIDNLIERQAEGEVRTHVIRGNHDRCLMDFLSMPQLAADFDFWIRPNWGGWATMHSYGVENALDRDPVDLQADLSLVFPPRHREFLDSLDVMVRIGSYAFVHAGVKPGIPLEAQLEEDTSWIREPFLTDRRDHGAIIVHGHTVVRQVENRGNRINVDTGLVFGGTLSCLVLEGQDQLILTPSGLVPCPVRR
jgi:serine/threonine protein phosphatase 1